MLTLWSYEACGNDAERHWLLKCACKHADCVTIFLERLHPIDKGDVMCGLCWVEPSD
jgi:hypothetical protein